MAAYHGQGIGVAGGREVSKPVSQSPYEMSVQECLTLLYSLRDTLFPQGIAPTRTVDDSVLDVHPQEGRLALDEGWKPVSTWESVAGALTATGPGSTAFVLARRSNGIGHAFAAYAIPADRDGNSRDGEGAQTGVVWIDLQAGPKGRVSANLPHIAPTEARAVIIANNGRVVPNTLPDFRASTSQSHPLIDPAANHQYGAIGMEVEFQQILNSEIGYNSEISYDDVLATHSSGSEIKVDRQDFYRGGDGRLYLDPHDATVAGSRDPQRVEFYIPEFVSSPAKVLPGEVRALDVESALNLVDLTRSRLDVKKTKALGEIFRSRDGWTVSPGFEQVKVNPAPEGEDRGSAYTQFTVGVPVGGLLPLLHLVETRMNSSTPELFSTSREFGRRLAERFLLTQYGRSLLPGEIDLLSDVPSVREVWGYGWLFFNHVAAAPVRDRFFKGSLVKNRTPAASRNPLGHIRAALRPEVIKFLERESEYIRSHFVKMLWQHFGELGHVSLDRRPDFSVLDEQVAHYRFKVGDYLTYAVNGRTATGKVVSQYHGIGMTSDPKYDTLEQHAGVPRVLLELRAYGDQGGVMSSQEMHQYFREISTEAQTYFQQQRNWLSPDAIHGVASRILAHPQVSAVAPLLEVAPQILKSPQADTSHQSSMHHGRTQFLAQALSELALRNTPLPAQALQELDTLAHAVGQALKNNAWPSASSPQDVRTRLSTAVQAAERLTTPAASRPAQPRPSLPNPPAPTRPQPPVPGSAATRSLPPVPGSAA
ncbi:hypothetical protein ACFVFJ_50165, partial [Streptomyces sp. NPDC057717]